MRTTRIAGVRRRKREIHLCYVSQFLFYAKENLYIHFSSSLRPEIYNNFVDAFLLIINPWRFRWSEHFSRLNFLCPLSEFDDCIAMYSVFVPKGRRNPIYWCNESYTIHATNRFRFPSKKSLSNCSSSYAPFVTTKPFIAWALSIVVRYPVNTKHLSQYYVQSLDLLCMVYVLCCMHNTSAHLESILIDLIVAPGDLRYMKRYHVIWSFHFILSFQSFTFNEYIDLASDIHW